jgi:hypothetical protein
VIVGLPVTCRQRGTSAAPCWAATKAAQEPMAIGRPTFDPRRLDHSPPPRTAVAASGQRRPSVSPDRSPRSAHVGRAGQRGRTCPGCAVLAAAEDTAIARRHCRRPRVVAVQAGRNVIMARAMRHASTFGGRMSRLCTSQPQLGCATIKSAWQRATVATAKTAGAMRRVRDQLLAVPRRRWR